MAGSQERRESVGRQVRRTAGFRCAQRSGVMQSSADVRAALPGPPDAAALSLVALPRKGGASQGALPAGCFATLACLRPSTEGIQDAASKQPQGDTDQKTAKHAGTRLRDSPGWQLRRRRRFAVRPVCCFTCPETWRGSLRVATRSRSQSPTGPRARYRPGLRSTRPRRRIPGSMRRASSSRRRIGR
jgi:hypothetical protein